MIFPSENNNILNEYCERCFYSNDIIISLVDENTSIDTPVFILKNWVNEDEDYGVSSNGHTRPNGSFTATGLTRIAPVIRINDFKIADIEDDSNTARQIADTISLTQGAVSYVDILMGVDTENINNLMSKGRRAIVNYYNQAAMITDNARRVMDFGKQSKKTTETTLNLLNAWASENNGNYCMYFNGLKYKSLALSFKKNSGGLGDITIDLELSHVPRVAKEPSLSSLKLPFVRGLTGEKENLVSQVEESTTLLKSLANSISFF